MMVSRLSSSQSALSVVFLVGMFGNAYAADFPVVPAPACWEAPPECAEMFTYNGKNYTGCSVEEYTHVYNFGWCSHVAVMDQAQSVQPWSYCHLQVPCGTPVKDTCWKAQDYCDPTYQHPTLLTKDGCVYNDPDQPLPWCSHGPTWQKGDKQSYCKPLESCASGAPIAPLCYKLPDTCVENFEWGNTMGEGCQNYEDSFYWCSEKPVYVDEENVYGVCAAASSGCDMSKHLPVLDPGAPKSTTSSTTRTIPVDERIADASCWEPVADCSPEWQWCTGGECQNFTGCTTLMHDKGWCVVGPKLADDYSNYRECILKYPCDKPASTMCWKKPWYCREETMFNGNKVAGCIADQEPVAYCSDAEVVQGDSNKYWCELQNCETKEQVHLCWVPDPACAKEFMWKDNLVSGCVHDLSWQTVRGCLLSRDGDPEEEWTTCTLGVNCVDGIPAIDPLEASIPNTATTTTTTISPTTTTGAPVVAASTNDSDDDSTGMIIGIVGGVAALVGIGAGCFGYRMWRKARDTASFAPTSDPMQIGASA